MLTVLSNRSNAMKGRSQKSNLLQTGPMLEDKRFCAHAIAFPSLSPKSQNLYGGIPPHVDYSNGSLHVFFSSAPLHHTKLHVGI